MPNPQLVVSPDWLYEHLDDPQVVVVDCRFSLTEPQLGRQQYQTSHIPGAYYLDLNKDLSSAVKQHGGRHPLPDPAQLTTKLSAMGIDSQSLVVVYDDSHFAFAARLWWLLRYMGHADTAVLDGGFKGWLSRGYGITDAVPNRLQTKFGSQLQLEQVVDIAVVKARKNLPGVVLVDSRESDRYRGEREPIDRIAGHIPGAVNYPWQEAVDVQGRLKSVTEQRRRWNKMDEAKEIIVYCGSGVTACVNLLSLEVAGLPIGKLYAGSWSDWCSYLV